MVWVGGENFLNEGFLKTGNHYFKIGICKYSTS